MKYTLAEKYEDVGHKSITEDINYQISFRLKERGYSAGEITDGYHTFNELYHHRAVLFAVICDAYRHLAWKSRQHYDSKDPMYDGMFIVGINTPEGQAAYHYDIDPYWGIFDVPEYDRAPKYDGCTSDESIKRIASLMKSHENI